MKASLHNVKIVQPDLKFHVCILIYAKVEHDQGEVGDRKQVFLSALVNSLMPKFVTTET